MINNSIYKGLITALITPFKNTGIDFQSLEKLLLAQFDASVNGIVISGSTGEASALSIEEYLSIVKFAVEFKKNHNKEIAIIAGCSVNNTDQAVKMARACENLGVDGIMPITPFYNKPNQSGLYYHFESIHEACGLPMMLYSVPARTAVDFSDDTILRLAELERVIAIKDASDDLERVSRIKYRLGDRINFLSGSDSLALGFNAQGGQGCVSVTANVAPKKVAKVQSLWFEGKIEESFLLQQELLPLHRAMFLDTNPIPVKYAVSVLGLCSSQVRLPLTPLQREVCEKIDAILLSNGLIKKNPEKLRSMDRY